MPARWTFGYQQSHRTLAGPDEVMWVAKTMREKKLPCDALLYLGEVWQHLRAKLVHHVRAVALEEAHHRLQSTHELALLGLWI